MTGRQRATCRASLKWLLGFGFLGSGIVLRSNTYIRVGVRRSNDYIPVVVPFHLTFSALLAES